MGGVRRSSFEHRSASLHADGTEGHKTIRFAAKENLSESTKLHRHGIKE
jgi:hypothetical protein